MKQIIKNSLWVLFFGNFFFVNIKRCTMEVNIQLIGTLFFATIFFVKTYDLCVAIKRFINIKTGRNEQK